MFQRPNNTYNIKPEAIDAILASETSPLKCISNEIKENSKILDIGAGNGLLGMILKKKFINIIIDGIEPCEYACEYGKPHYQNLYCGFAQNYLNVVNQNNYDYIVMADLLEHLENPYNFLNTLKNSINYKTKYLFSIPNVAFGAVRIALLNGDFKYVDSGLLEKTHLRFFTLDTIKELLDKIGLTIEKIYYLQHELDKTEINMDNYKINKNIYNTILKDDLASVYQFFIVASTENEIKTVEKFIGTKSKPYGFLK